MLFIHGIRNKPPLPKISPPPLSKVDSSRVEAMCLPECMCKATFCLWSGNNVHMIVHEAICRYFDSFGPCILPQEFKVSLAIVVIEKDALSSIPPLNNMMWKSGCDDPSHSYHDQSAQIVPTWVTWCTANIFDLRQKRA